MRSRLLATPWGIFKVAESLAKANELAIQKMDATKVEDKGIKDRIPHRINLHTQGLGIQKSKAWNIGIDT